MSNRCHLCGMEGDTLFHRVYRCPCTRDEVTQAILARIWKEVNDEQVDKDYKLGTSGISPHLVDVALLPIEGSHYTLTELDIDGFDAADFGGDVYIDGSCFPSAVKGLSRADCAIVEVDKEGFMVRQALMPVPRHFPQTAQAAEYVAYAMAMRITTRPRIWFQIAWAWSAQELERWEKQSRQRQRLRE